MYLITACGKFFGYQTIMHCTNKYKSTQDVWKVHCYNFWDEFLTPEPEEKVTLKNCRNMRYFVD